MLTPHRRHLKSCDHAAKGWNFTLCNCPVWCDGTLRGQRIKKSLGTNSWERGLAKIAALERGVDIGIEVSANRTLRHAVQSFLASCSRRKLKGSTIGSYTRTLNTLCASIGARQIESVLPSDIEAHLGRRELKPRTQRKELEYIRALFAWCVDQGWIAKNPGRAVKPPKIWDVATLPYTAEEIGKLLTACDQMRGMWKSDTPYVRKRARAAILTMLYSGLRVIDVAGLKRSALEASGHLYLRTEKTGVPVKVLLHADARKALNALPGNPTYFFWSGHGKLTNCAKSLWRTVSRVGRLAGVHAHPHRFRDSFAVELLTNGADIRTVQKLLGHDSVKTTEKHYAHFVAAHQQRLDSAASTLDFTPKPSRPVLVRSVKKRLGNAK